MFSKKDKSRFNRIRVQILSLKRDRPWLLIIAAGSANFEIWEKNKKCQSFMKKINPHQMAFTDVGKSYQSQIFNMANVSFNPIRQYKILAKISKF